METLKYKTQNGLLEYEYYCNNKTETLVLLHGWGQNIETFSSIIADLKESYNVIAINFYGFGSSIIENNKLTLKDYANDIHELLLSLNVDNPIFIGHSFGGRVSIKYGSLYHYKKIFLIASPAFKNRSIKYYKKIFIYKLKKSFYKTFNNRKYKLYIRNSGSIDYINCKDDLKEVFKNIVRLDLKKDLKKLCNPIIIFASVNDNVVNYKKQLMMYKIIKNSKLYTFYKSGHFIHIDEEVKVLKIIKREIDG